MRVPAAVGAAADAVAPLRDPGPLLAACAAWEAPEWRVAVIGRTGVGKSSLTARLTGATRPTGLGGVTAQVEAVPGPDALLVLDTPGLDEPSGRAALPEVIGQADAVIWVVDGLQPLTASEREAVAAAWPGGTDLVVAVSRLDLVDADEVASVLARVERLVAPLDPRRVLRIDPRAPAPDGLVSRAPSRRRQEGVRRALRDLRDALDALPAPLDRAGTWDRLRARWRDVVRGVAEDQEPPAVMRGAHAAREAFLGALHQDTRLGPWLAAGEPLLPLPALDAWSWQRMLGGEAATRREVRRRLAEWLVEGEVALREWLGEPRPEEQGVADAQAAREAIEAALEAVAEHGSR